MPTPINKAFQNPDNYRQYDKKAVFEALRKYALDNPNCIYFSDIVYGVGLRRDYVYKAFPDGSKERTELQDILNKNVDATKRQIRDRLLNINQSVGLIALYRILGTEDERAALATSPKMKTEVKDDNKDITLTIG